MTDQPQLHDLTKFLLSRKESYPEEFKWPAGGGRWDKHINTVWKYGGEADRRALGFVPQRHTMSNALRSALQELLVPEAEAPHTRAMKTTMRITQEMQAVLEEEFKKAFNS